MDGCIFLQKIRALSAAVGPRESEGDDKWASISDAACRCCFFSWVKCSRIFSQLVSQISGGWSRLSDGDGACTHFVSFFNDLSSVFPTLVLLPCQTRIDHRPHIQPSSSKEGIAPRRPMQILLLVISIIISCSTTCATTDQLLKNDRVKGKSIAYRHPCFLLKEDQYSFSKVDVWERSVLDYARKHE